MTVVSAAMGLLSTWPVVVSALTTFCGLIAVRRLSISLRANASTVHASVGWAGLPNGLNAQFSAPDTAFITAATGLVGLTVGAVTLGVSRFVVADTGLGDAVTALVVTFMTVGATAATLTGLGAAVCWAASGLAAGLSGVSCGRFGVFGTVAVSLGLSFFGLFVRSRPLAGALVGLSVLGSGVVSVSGSALGSALGADELSPVLPAAGVSALSSPFLGRGLSRRGLARCDRGSDAECDGEPSDPADVACGAHRVSLLFQLIN